MGADLADGTSLGESEDPTTWGSITSSMVGSS